MGTQKKNLLYPQILIYISICWLNILFITLLNFIIMKMMKTIAKTMNGILVILMKMKEQTFLNKKQSMNIIIIKIIIHIVISHIVINYILINHIVKDLNLNLNLDQFHQMIIHHRQKDLKKKKS